MRTRGRILSNSNKLILHISNMASGQGIFVHEQIEALKENSSFTHEHFTIRKAKEHKVNTYLLAISRIRAQILIKKPSVVHIHFGLTAIFAMFANMLIKLKIRYVISFYGSDLMSSKMQKFLTIIATYILRADVVVVSQNLNDELSILNSRKYIIPNSVDPLFFDRDTRDISEIDLIFPSDPVRSEKDFNFFIGVIRLLQAEGYIVNIKIMTQMSRVQIRNCLSQNSIVCLTSKREGSPQIIKEAIVRGIPCICRPVGDVDRYVNDYSVFTVDSEEGFKTLIKDVMSKKIRPSFDTDVSQFTSATMLKRLQEVYENVINEA